MSPAFIPVPDLQVEVLTAEARRATLAAADGDIQRRALLAHLKAKNGYVQPTADPLMLEFRGKLYVAIPHESGPLAIFRVRNDRQLKRLRRIPLPLVAATHLASNGALQLHEGINHDGE